MLIFISIPNVTATSVFDFVFFFITLFTLIEIRWVFFNLVLFEFSKRYCLFYWLYKIIYLKDNVKHLISVFSHMYYVLFFKPWGKT